MTQLRVGLLVFAALFVLSGCSTSRPPEFPDSASLREKIELTREHLRLPGAAVYVRQGNRVLIGDAFGVASLETDEPLTTGHRFRVASLAKPMIATVLLQLVDEGRVGLDDPVSRHLSGVPAGERITLRMLAQHTSGLRNYVAIPKVKRELAREPERSWMREELLQRAYDFGPHFDPDDDGWFYSNTNYILLGMVIERVEGQPIGEVLERRVFTPLGMESTFYSVEPGMPEPYASGYQMGDAAGPTYWVGEGDVHWDVTDASPSMWHDAGAVVSTLNDTRLFLDALIDGALVSEASHAKQLSWRDTGYPVEYGYGLGVMNYKGTVGHSGLIPGYQVTAVHEPESDIMVVVLANLYSSFNHEDPANAISFVVLRHLTGRSFAPPGWDGW